VGAVAKGRYDFQVELFDPRGHAVECVIRAQDLTDLIPRNADVAAGLDALAKEPNGELDLALFVVSKVGMSTRGRPRFAPLAPQHQADGPRSERSGTELPARPEVVRRSADPATALTVG
jgi:hypothetical protein